MQTTHQKKCCCLNTVSHVQSVGQLWVSPLVTQHCSMWWLASRPPTLLPASPAVFSITMRSCGVVNLPTMTLLSPLPSVLSPSLSTFPHSLLSSSPPLADTHTRSRLFCNFSPAVTSTLFTLLCATADLFFFKFSPQTPARLHPAAHSPSSLEPWLSLASSPSFTRASKYPLAATVTPEEEYILDSVMLLHPNKTTQSKVCISLTCQGFLVVFPHGHKVLQTGVELVQNPLMPTNNRTFLTISPHTVLFMMLSNKYSLVKSIQPDHIFRNFTFRVPCRHFLSSCWPLLSETFFLPQLCPFTIRFLLSFPPLIQDFKHQGTQQPPKREKSKEKRTVSWEMIL